MRDETKLVHYMYADWHCCYKNPNNTINKGMPDHFCSKQHSVWGWSDIRNRNTILKIIVFLVFAKCISETGSTFPNLFCTKLFKVDSEHQFHAVMLKSSLGQNLVECISDSIESKLQGLKILPAMIAPTSEKLNVFLTAITAVRMLHFLPN